MKNKINPWKVVAILLLVFSVAIFFKGEYEKKQINENIIDCNLKKNLCTSTLNQSMIGWTECIYNFGYYMNLTDSEIKAALSKPLGSEDDFYLNLQEVKK